MDERGPTLLSGSAKLTKTQEQTAKTVDKSEEDRRRRNNDKIRQVASPDSYDVPMDNVVEHVDGIERFVGIWFDREGTQIGQIEGHVMTWAFDECPPSELRLSASG